MATVATFTLDSHEFPLGTVFAGLPEVTVELERVIPNGNGVTPYFWVTGAETDDILSAFSDHPGVEDIRVVDSVKDDYLLRCEWSSNHTGVLDAITAPELVLLSAVGTSEQWTFELRGENRMVIAEFQSFCTEHDIPVELTELHALRALETAQDVTDTQREALVLAYERGYFNTPRETTLEKVADELGISQQALGSRLRRANRRLIENEITNSSS